MNIQATAKEFDNITTKKCIISIGNTCQIHFPNREDFESVSFSRSYHKKKATITAFNEKGGLDLLVENGDTLENILPSLLIMEGTYYECHN